MRGIKTAPHEFDANLHYGGWGLDPYFAFNQVIKESDGARTKSFEIDDEQWIAQLGYRNDSNILYPGDQTPAGTDWRLNPDTSTEIDTIRHEYYLKIARHPDEDPVGQQEFKCHISPRWPGMDGLKGDGSTTRIHNPFGDDGEGINVRVQGSNIEFGRYPMLLIEAFRALDLNPGYVGEWADSSNIRDAERYVRVHRDKSGPIHARDGPLAALGHLLESDRDGYRKVVQQDVDYRGEQVPGYYHTTTLGSKRISEAWETHKLPKEIKHYYARDSAGLPDDHPLAHPKLGASYQVSRTAHDETLYFDDLDEMNRELEETVHSVLRDADLDLNPIGGTGPYVTSDAYFNCEFGEVEPPTKLTLTRIKQEQESVVVKHLASGLSPTQWESLEQLATDGGSVSPQDIADDAGRHVESVRRALRGMDDLVETSYGEVDLRSSYVAEVVHQAVQDAAESVERAIDTVAQAADDAERMVDQHVSAWKAWLRKHGVNHSDEIGENIELELGEMESKSDVVSLLRQGESLWSQMGQSVEDYRHAKASWRTEQNGRVVTKRGTVWRLFNQMPR